MAELITKTFQNQMKMISQCDIFKDVEFIEYVKEEKNIIEASKIVFPLVIVLTQSCDLQQDYNTRKKMEKSQERDQDKLLISVIVAPIYNFEDFRMGEHLNQIGLTMLNQGKREKTPCKKIIENENKRYHYLKFDDSVDIVESVIDFKHYFTVTINYLNSIYDTNYKCSVESLYRELIVQRFSNFLSRIGLPDPE